MTQIKIESGGRCLTMGGARITFHRTNRIADDGHDHGLPPSLGALPIRRVSDYADLVPAEWLAKGGVFIPLREKEAMWLGFSGSSKAALKVGVGMVNAVTGLPWRDALSASPQDYMVLPQQPWLDGIKSERGTIRQFVAAQLGQGYTVEGQLSGEEVHGGIQLLACPGKYIPPRPAPPWSGPVKRRRRGGGTLFSAGSAAGGMMSRSESGPRSKSIIPDTQMYDMDCEMEYAAAPMAGAAPMFEERERSADATMGMAAGGSMVQSIYRDPMGISHWNQRQATRVFVHLCTAEAWERITGEYLDGSSRPAGHPSSGPWYGVLDGHLPSVPGSDILDSVQTIDEIDADRERDRHARRVRARLRAQGAGSPPPTIIVDDGH